MNQNINVLELKQSIKGRLLAVAVILFCAIVVLLIYNYVQHLQEPEWFLMAVGLLIIVNQSLDLYMSLWLCPQKIIVKEENITLSMLMRKRKNIKISDILMFKYGPLISIIVNNSGWIIGADGKRKCMIAKQYFSNYDELIERIKAGNSKCSIDERMLKWKGPRYLDF
jgi:hypothetical protein